GLTMIKQLSGIDAVKNLVKDAGVSIPEKADDKTIMDTIQKHLEAGGSLKRARGLTVGRESVAVTERGTSVKTQYKVVEVEDLIASNTVGGAINPNFPTELQPRDRSKTASKLQVRQIASNLDFNRLGESTLASSGSPIVGNDRVVESGNGRILAIQTAYMEGNEASKN
ncbi:hypothetical protein SB749_18660, partial [Brevibacterium sp. SIMBA_078]|uniref:hypothetical protein n=1 Tax=Brevibacterium sp. SIMBA_078 TaxID=3085816 RepID=UPI00397B8340